MSPDSGPADSVIDLFLLRSAPGWASDEMKIIAIKELLDLVRYLSPEAPLDGVGVPFT